ncbi:MAG: MoaD/ThiS family protein [Methanopyri archaeon]|jgi:sulfur carrier protein ThiS|nr:MoaD/ThiS family protein [Methanopyri archaeon]
MRVKVRIFGKDPNTAELPDTATIGELLTAQGINPVIVVPTVGGRLVPEDAELTDGDEVVLYPAVSGG